MDFLEYWDTRIDANKDKSAAVMNLLYDEATILHEWMLEEANTLRARLAEVEKEHAGLQEAVRWKDEVLQDSALWSIQTQTAFLEWNATVREARAAVDALVGEG